MGVTLCALRMSENYRLMQENELQMMQNSRMLRKLSKFSSAVANGNISPGMLSGLGDLLPNALSFLEDAHEQALLRAQDQLGMYETQFNNMASTEAYQNSSFMQNAQLYLDENGQLDLTRLEAEFYEEAVKDFANDILMPELKDIETEIQNENDQLELENQQLSAEYDQLQQARSQEIQRQTIQLA